MTIATRIHRLETRIAAAESISIAERLEAAIKADRADPDRFRIRAQTFLEEIEESERAGIRPSSIELRLKGTYRRILQEDPEE
jgi:hypothetical protein